MKHRALVYALLLILLTTLPYLIGWARQGDDWQFSGFLFGLDDGNSYLGKMRLGARGIWDFHLFYTPEPHDGVPLVFLPYIIPGYVVGRIIPETDPAHTTALIVTFHLLRIIFDLLLLVLLDRFIAVFIPSPKTRFLALVLATIGGGFGWLLSFTGILPPEFFIPEGFGFMILFGLPHLALARAALLGGLLLVAKRTEYRVPSTEPRAVSTRSSVLSPQHSLSQHSALSTQCLLAAAAGICWLIVGLAVPFYLAILYCILGAWGLAAWLRERRFPFRLFVRCAVAAGITLPMFVYYAIAFANNPAFAVWSAQNQLPSPPPLHYVLAYGVLALPALLGIRRAWQQAHEAIRYALLVGWVIIVPLLVYLPINVQRRMAEAVIVPLAILAALGIAAWVSGRKNRRWLAGAWLVAACLSTFLLWSGGLFAANSPKLPLFRPTGEIAALNWLNARAAPDAVVLSSFETGNLIPAYTHLRPFVGHGPETLEGQRKTALVESFFAGEMSAAEREALYNGLCLEAQPRLCADPAEYLIYGWHEQALAPVAAPPNWLDEWTLIYEAGSYQIYKRPEETP